MMVCIQTFKVLKIYWYKQFYLLPLEQELCHVFFFIFIVVSIINNVYSGGCGPVNRTLYLEFFQNQSTAIKSGI